MDPIFKPDPILFKQLCKQKLKPNPSQIQQDGPHVSGDETAACMPPERKLHGLLTPGRGATGLTMSHTYVGIKKHGVVKEGNTEATGSDLYRRSFPCCDAMRT